MINIRVENKNKTSLILMKMKEYNKILILSSKDQNITYITLYTCILCRTVNYNFFSIFIYK